MPIYEYQCKQCNDRQEVIQTMSEPPLEHCPKCGGEMKKLLSSPAIQFKGSGFYKTDYASGSSSAPAPKSESKSEAKTESKSESPKSSESSAPAAKTSE
ncbi:MAG TPA: FmdB family zinc ribbon protein [Thermoanaerobaculia bacterium]|jgi:putative FmdB family regulatory protein